MCGGAYLGECGCSVLLMQAGLRDFSPSQFSRQILRVYTPPPPPPLEPCHDCAGLFSRMLRQLSYSCPVTSISESYVHMSNPGFALGVGCGLGGKGEMGGGGRGLQPTWVSVGGSVLLMQVGLADISPSQFLMQILLQSSCPPPPPPPPPPPTTTYHTTVCSHKHQNLCVR